MGRKRSISSNLILFSIFFILSFFIYSFSNPTYVYIKSVKTFPLIPLENIPFDIIIEGEYSSSSQGIFSQFCTISEDTITIIFKNKIPDSPSLTVLVPFEKKVNVEKLKKGTYSLNILIYNYNSYFSDLPVDIDFYPDIYKIEVVEKDKVQLKNSSSAYNFLCQRQDEYFNLFYVYDDFCSGGNHFLPTGFFGDKENLKVYQDNTEDVFDGLTSIKVEFISNGINWSGLYWQNPENNWGNIPNSGYNLSGATEISFYAKGAKGGEKVEFFAGGINGLYPDSLDKVSTGLITLTSDWKKYTISLNFKDLSYVIGGFGFSVSGANNPNGATFYIDKIQYNLLRNNELRFLRSYKTINFNEPDKYLHNTCFIYDNALSLMAFIIKGERERAKIIADSFIFAMNNDRFYKDNRLRNAYMSGDLNDINTGYARISGWWDNEFGIWREDEYQVSTYTGNIAWVIISLSHFYLKYGGEEYKTNAIKLGEWIYLNTYDTRGNGGYTGGYRGWEPNPQKINWKSTEHNIDIYSAFKLLYKITGDTKWEERANHSKNFVLSMYDSSKNYFYSGTQEDGITPEQQPISLDVQVWSILSGIIDFSQEKLNFIEENFLTTNNGFEGFDFNTDKDGVWFEGTSFMPLLYNFTGFTDKATKYIEELKKAQISAPNSDKNGIVSSSKDGLSTGLEWQYYTRLHTGTTSWFIFAQNLFNPFTGYRKGDIDSDYEVDIKDVILCLRMAIGLNKQDLNLADMNRDGTIDITDVILVLRKAIGLD